MTLPRKQLISIEETPYYHIVSRCVRRAFLCGRDPVSDRSYEHRRKWIVERVKYLAGIFTIDICAYAVMHNHYHLVLKVNSTEHWSTKQVLVYWGALCALPRYCQQYLDGDDLGKTELQWVEERASEYRQRLMSISWFMKLLNQHIALAANAEDKCTGHFWENRFKSQALLDESALLTCMAYVDLNPIRAAIADTPKTSEFTSIQERIRVGSTDLLAFGQGMQDLQYSLNDYMNLVDYTGRAILQNKCGYIPNELPAIAERLGLNPDTWLEEINSFSSRGFTAVGTVEQLRQFCATVGKKWNLGLKLIPALE
ncbi:MAG: transposase [Proteobacteria bacterium]|nr:transposase [Pseudomonadota bacterium]